MLFFSVANAQSPKASEFYPLQVGNVWQYQSINQNDLGSEQSVVGDTTLGDSILIYEVLARSFQTNGRVFEDVGYLAYNEDSTIVYAMSTLRQDLFPDIFDPFNAVPYLNTNDGIGGKWEILLGDTEVTAAITDTGIVAFYDELRKWVSVNSIVEEADSIRIIPDYSATFIEGIGFSRFDTDTLVYARIDGIEFGSPVVGIRHENNNHSSLPDMFELQVYPNPIRNRTTISLQNLHKPEVEIQIFDILGRVVREFKANSNNTNSIQINWDGMDYNGSPTSNGTYFVRVRAGKEIQVIKFTILR